jgi:hypothetical protein
VEYDPGNQAGLAKKVYTFGLKSADPVQLFLASGDNQTQL